MECTHGQLSSRFANGLGCNNTNRLTHVDNMAASQISTIALGTDTSFALAGQYGADLDLFKASIFNALNEGLINLMVCVYQYLSGNRIENIVKSNSTKDTITNMFDDLTALSKRRNNKTIQCSAIIFSNNGVLSNVNKSTSQVTRVSRLK